MKDCLAKAINFWSLKIWRSLDHTVEKVIKRNYGYTAIKEKFKRLHVAVNFLSHHVIREGFFD